MAGGKTETSECNIHTLLLGGMPGDYFQRNTDTTLAYLAKYDIVELGNHVVYVTKLKSPRDDSEVLHKSGPNEEAGAFLS